MPKNNVVSHTPKFVVRKSVLSLEFLRIEYVDGLKINWTTDAKLASPYSSKCAAKNHLKTLRLNFEMPENTIIEELV